MEQFSLQGNNTATELGMVTANGRGLDLTLTLKSELLSFSTAPFRRRDNTKSCKSVL